MKDSLEAILNETFFTKLLPKDHFLILFKKAFLKAKRKKNNFWQCLKKMEKIFSLSDA